MLVLSDACCSVSAATDSVGSRFGLEALTAATFSGECRAIWSPSDGATTLMGGRVLATTSQEA